MFRIDKTGNSIEPLNARSLVIPPKTSRASMDMAAQL